MIDYKKKYQKYKAKYLKLKGGVSDNSNIDLELLEKIYGKIPEIKYNTTNYTQDMVRADKIAQKLQDDSEIALQKEDAEIAQRLQDDSEIAQKLQEEDLQTLQNEQEAVKEIEDIPIIQNNSTINMIENETNQNNDIMKIVGPGAIFAILIIVLTQLN